LSDGLSDLGLFARRGELLGWYGASVSVEEIARMSVRVEERRWIAGSDDRPRPLKEEAVWITRARAGDEAGFRWLLEQYRERAIRLATHVLMSQQEAEDVAQEAFVKAFRSLRSFRGESRFYTWLYHIVVRICLDRRKLARWRLEAPAESFDLAIEQTPAADDRMVVEMLMDRLTPPIRAALVLRELEGLEYEEIALVLEIPVGTVRSRLNTARKRFRAMWEAARRETQDV
jgi:RNA polymerase sigma-70 factor (ECF subfamily)